jgi:GTP cyclohydrolase I
MSLRSTDQLARHTRVAQIKPLLREVLTLLGEDPEREGLRDTPERWAEALLTYTSGIDDDAARHLQVTFRLDDDDHLETSDEMVIVRNIRFASTCEHHIAPFNGVAHIAYIPDVESGRVAGLSKLARVVEVFARRLQIQERMTHQIANAIQEHLQPLGVMVAARAVHSCMVQRGVEQHGSVTVTAARRGVFLSDATHERRFHDFLRMADQPGPDTV